MLRTFGQGFSQCAVLDACRIKKNSLCNLHTRKSPCIFGSSSTLHTLRPGCCMTNGGTVHVPVGIPLMTDAALVRTLFEFKQQLTLATSGTLEMQADVQSRIVEAIDEIETELRDREIDPEALHPGSATAFAGANVLRFVSLDGGES